MDLHNLRKCLENAKSDMKRAENEYKKELAASVEHISKVLFVINLSKVIYLFKSKVYRKKINGKRNKKTDTKVK